jgi:hypothetical protein
MARGYFASREGLVIITDFQTEFLKIGKLFDYRHEAFERVQDAIVVQASQ